MALVVKGQIDVGNEALLRATTVQRPVDNYGFDVFRNLKINRNKWTTSIFVYGPSTNVYVGHIFINTSMINISKIKEI